MDRWIDVDFTVHSDVQGVLFSLQREVGREEHVVVTNVCETLTYTADLLLREQQRISGLKQDVDSCRPRFKVLHREKEDRLEQQVTRLEIIRMKLQERREEWLAMRLKLLEQKRKTQQLLSQNPNKNYECSST